MARKWRIIKNGRKTQGNIGKNAEKFTEKVDENA